MSKFRLYALAVASTIFVAGACQSTQSSDTAGGTEAEPTRTTGANATDSLADTTRRDTTTTPGAPTTPPPSTPPGAR